MICDKCGGNLSKVWFVDKEQKDGHDTGRVRNAVSHLVCDECGANHIVDDSFDGPWTTPPTRPLNRQGEVVLVG